MPAQRLRQPIRLAAALLVAAGALGACGSSHPKAGPDPASVVPASAPVYAAATVHPTGSLKDSAASAGRALTGEGDPYLRLVGALQTPGSPPLDYKRDLQPWLGTRAGLFLDAGGAALAAEGSRLLTALRQGLSRSGSPPRVSGMRGALVLDTSDRGRARDFLARQAAFDHAHSASYRGGAYRVAADGTAFGLVGEFAVIGSESALRAVIDTSRDGVSLVRSADYARLSSLAPAGTLAHLFFAASSHAAPAGNGVLELLTGGAPANLSLVPTAGSLVLDADTLGGSRGLIAADPEAAQALGELPGESFLGFAFGRGRLGPLARVVEAIPELVGSSPEASSSPLSLHGILAALLVPMRALSEQTPAARRDFASWMGPGAIFASGTGLVDLRAGLVISSRSARGSRAAVQKLAARVRAAGGSVSRASIAGTDAAADAQLPSLPVSLAIAAGPDASGQPKFVVGLGDASVSAALQPAGALRRSSSLAGADGLLGEGIQASTLLQVSTLLSLLEGVGLSEDPSLAPAIPYLRALGTVAVGSRSLGGGAQRLRAVVTLRQGG